MSLKQCLQNNPVIAAVMEEARLSEALKSPCEVIFLLAGNINTTAEMVRHALAHHKKIYLHMDLLGGFGKDKHAIRYIKENICPSGVITTKTGLTKIARELSLPVIQRIFAIDNLSLQTGIQSLRQNMPDAVEVMPGLMPAVAHKLAAATNIPVICGGLINEKEDIIAALGAGAIGASTSNKKLWYL